MAQSKKSISFKNAVINMNDHTITEFAKDETRTYDLDSILREWEGVTDISLSIQQASDIEPVDND